MNSSELNTLGVMPGDDIHFDIGSGPDWSTVKTCGWQPGPNGGKIWTYETTEGTLVPHTHVTDIRKFKLKNDVTVKVQVKKQDFVASLYELDISPDLKTAMYCLFNGSLKHLEVAEFLIGERIRQLNELK